MHDQWVEAGASFGLINPGDGLAIGGIRSEAIDRFRRHRDQVARLNQSGGARNSICIWFKSLRFHETRDAAFWLFDRRIGYITSVARGITPTRANAKPHQVDKFGEPNAVSRTR